VSSKAFSGLLAAACTQVQASKPTDTPLCPPTLQQTALTAVAIAGRALCSSHQPTAAAHAVVAAQRILVAADRTDVQLRGRVVAVAGHCQAVEARGADRAVGGGACWAGGAGGDVSAAAVTVWGWGGVGVGLGLREGVEGGEAGEGGEGGEGGRMSARDAHHQLR